MSTVGTPGLVVLAPDTVCVCGGYLRYDAGRYVHVGACGTCYDPRTGVRSACNTPWRHDCGRSTPEQCTHHNAPRSVAAVDDCATGDGPCCGCCRPDDPYRD